MRRVEPVLKTLLILFILHVFFSVPAMGYNWKLWCSLDKSQYSADSYGEASIVLQNTGTTMIHIKEILITFVGGVGGGVLILLYQWWRDRKMPKINVLDEEIYTTDIIRLRVKNVGAEGKVTASVGNNSKFKARWFKLNEEIKGIGGEKEKNLARGEECFVSISRRAAHVINRNQSDLGLHYITVRFPETYQVFMYAFRITNKTEDGGIKDLEFFGHYKESWLNWLKKKWIERKLR